MHSTIYDAGKLPPWLLSSASCGVVPANGDALKGGTALNPSRSRSAATFE